MAAAPGLSDAPLGECRASPPTTTGALQRWDLSLRGLSGEIPPELGSLSNLTFLYLSGNELGGEIPASWAASPT